MKTNATDTRTAEALDLLRRITGAGRPVALVDLFPIPPVSAATALRLLEERGLIEVIDRVRRTFTATADGAAALAKNQIPSPTEAEIGCAKRRAVMGDPPQAGRVRGPLFRKSLGR